MQVLINPGSGAVQNGSKEQSEMNLKQFLSDLGIKANYEFVKVEDDGRHSYKVWNETHTHEIEMPAIPLENVRYLGAEGQNIFNFPRLYVDGSSWVWKYALSVCFNPE